MAITLLDAGGTALLSGTYSEDAAQAALDPQPAVVFGGTPTTIELSLDPASFTIGVPSTATLSALAYDAQNREIIGTAPFATPIAVTSSFQGTKLSATALVAPTSAIAVTYDGSNGSQATFAGSGGPTTIVSVTAAILTGTTTAGGEPHGDAKLMTVQEMNAIPTAPPLPAPIGSFQRSARAFSTPAQVNLTANFPPVANQGTTNNCTVFSGVYAIMSYYSRVQRASNPNWILTGSGVFGQNPATTFSPTFTYNQPSVNGGVDKGARLDGVARSLATIGAVPMSLVPFDPSNPSISYLTPALVTIASAFRISNYYIIPTTPANLGASVQMIKSYLSAGYPIYMAMVVDGAAGNLTAANPVLTANDGVSPGGHAMVFVGYNDSVAGGSFRVMNSWGADAADRGFFWLPYSFWTNGVKEPEAMIFTVNPPNEAIYNV